MKVRCPECGEVFQVQIRARVGKGSVAGRKLLTINRNKLALCQVLDANSSVKNQLSVVDVQRVLYRDKVKRWQYHKDTDRPTGGWNYHHVQADLSLLVGRGLVSMSTATENFDEDRQEYVTTPVPRYWMTPNQAVMYREILENDGVIPAELFSELEMEYKRNDC